MCDVENCLFLQQLKKGEQDMEENVGQKDKEKVEEIKSQQAAVEQKIERVAAEENTDTEDYDNSDGFESNSVVEDDNGRYVICPKCGEKVWL